MDNQKRFALFCRAAIESIKALPFMPGEDCMIVCNDWHTTPVPVLLKSEYKKRGEFKDTKTALCIHNIAFQVGTARAGAGAGPAGRVRHWGGLVTGAPVASTGRSLASTSRSLLSRLAPTPPAGPLLARLLWRAEPAPGGRQPVRLPGKQGTALRRSELQRSPLPSPPPLVGGEALHPAASASARGALHTEFP